MIGNIGGQIRRNPVIADDDAVLIVAVIRRFQPQGPVFFIDLSPALQDIAGRLDGVRMESPFTEPVVIRNIKIVPNPV